ncbi:nuclease-related domain-containing DEAD/DEAH box helicase [Lacimicrobium alkaliphilum]|uniref:NERD domain-containing protein n=1 Tax=Lacimicrobium alkaliphilum TaxID=1526571 RepID=A0ABQ1R833_9ALTE|nr:NERD domain-containing protein/DEAD/DEAH box helicase [Lacimicrobium alkaliphilum]GGD59602.1 hypothetical protein GCM10011357_13630 [Lacimicrobium alkaliphilum]
MKMNPEVVYRFDSNAERKLFQAFERTNFEGATVFHSLNIPKHQKKQFSEADFVIVSNKGILVLEVKGGRLSVKGGIWYTRDRNNNDDRLKESPVAQVTSARISIEKMLQEKPLDINLKRVNFGFGVMFPDVKLGDIGIELTKEEVFDVIDWDRKNLGRWLEKLYRYWTERTGRNQRLTDHEVAVLCSAMREEFDREKSLLASVGESWDQMISLTEQQYLAVDTIIANKQVVVEGGAGTGKTLVAIKAAKGLAFSGKRVLFVCRSPVLTSFVRDELKGAQFQVVKFSTLQESRNNISIFDCLIVDEGQDMLDMDSISVIDSLFENGMSHGSWYFFMDPNNQSSLYAQMDVDAAEYLKSCGTKVPLSRNCRNTKQIAIHTLIFTGGNIGKCKVLGDGLPVLEKELDHDSRVHLVSLVETQLSKWIDEDGVKPGDIVLLSPLSYEQSCAQQLDKRWRRKITIINESFGERWLDTALPFSTIRDFKGLENKYVMILDLGALLKHSNATNELYVAMTRANTVLWMSIPKSEREWFNRCREENASSLLAYLEDVDL